MLYLTCVGLELGLETNRWVFVDDQSNDYSRGNPENVASDGVKCYTDETIYSWGPLVHLALGGEEESHLFWLRFSMYDSTITSVPALIYRASKSPSCHLLPFFSVTSDNCFFLASSLIQSSLPPHHKVWACRAVLGQLRPLIYWA